MSKNYSLFPFALRDKAKLFIRKNSHNEAFLAPLIFLWGYPQGHICIYTEFTHPPHPHCTKDHDYNVHQERIIISHFKTTRSRPPLTSRLEKGLGTSVQRHCRLFDFKIVQLLLYVSVHVLHISLVLKKKTKKYSCICMLYNSTPEHIRTIFLGINYAICSYLIKSISKTNLLSTRRFLQWKSF